VFDLVSLLVLDHDPLARRLTSNVAWRSWGRLRKTGIREEAKEGNGECDLKKRIHRHLPEVGRNEFPGWVLAAPNGLRSLLRRACYGLRWTARVVALLEIPQGADSASGFATLLPSRGSSNG
jgi:hypothetical protein